MTDGYFVDNDGTYPHFLEEALRDRLSCVEVINGARGGGTIGREYAILREIGFPLNPDIAVLTFVTNDIAEMHGQSLKNYCTQKSWKRGRCLPGELRNGR